MLGKVIRDYRKARERGWTQAQLAERARVTQQAISYAERTGDVGREVLVGCARAFGVPVEELLAAAGLAAPPSLETLEDEGIPTVALDALRKSGYPDLTARELATALHMARLAREEFSQQPQQRARRPKTPTESGGVGDQGPRGADRQAASRSATGPTRV